MGMIMSISGVQGREPLKHGGLPGPVRRRPLRRRCHLHRPLRQRVHRPGRARRRFHHRVRRLHHDGHPDHVPLYGRHPGAAAAGRQYVRPSHALPGRVDYRPDRRRRLLGRPGRVLPMPRNAGGTLCRPGPARRERRGAGPHRHRLHQGTGQVGTVPQGRRVPDALRPGAKPRRNWPTAPSWSPATSTGKSTTR